MTTIANEQLTVTLGSSGVTPEDVVAVARHGAKVTLSPEALDTVAKVRAHIDGLATSDVPAYGISTGFGALANRHIPNDLRTQLQKSLIRSHAAGMGPAVEREVIRGIMFLRAKTLASGRTGVRPVVLQTMVDVLNAGITPVVREFGSLGCSGDLAPLSHCALVLMGEGEATGPDGELYGAEGKAPVAELLSQHGIEPVTLAEKEGLALVNGTEGMLGMLLMAIADLRVLLATADVTAALSVEALLGTDQVPARSCTQPCVPTRARLPARTTCSGCCPTHRSWLPTGSTTPRSRTPTRSVAHLRLPAQSATPWTMPPWWLRVSLPQRSTTRCSLPTAA